MMMIVSKSPCLSDCSGIIYVYTGFTVGFDPDVYEVVEDAGSVTLIIRLIGVLERDVTVFYETNPGTATSAGIYTMYHALLYQICSMTM